MATFCLTLPISCQICLGKVKSPVVCPNLHVFCENCLLHWLQKSSNCPTCRVTLPSESPFRRLHGNEEIRMPIDSTSNSALRRTRFELALNEYEAELGRLESTVTMLKEENSQLRRDNSAPIPLESSEPDEECHPPPQRELELERRLGAFSDALNNTTNENVSLKEENDRLKQEIDRLGRENSKLRCELVSRSPHKYGRFAVAALETKTDDMEREVARLRKALERSDQYIDELEVKARLAVAGSSSARRNLTEFS